MEVERTKSPAAGDRLLVVALRGAPSQKIPEGKVGRYPEEFYPACINVGGRWYDLRTMTVVYGVPVEETPDPWRELRD